MKETGKDRFILTKAYEIAYALFRLAEPLKEKDFAESLRASGTALLAAAAAEDHAATGRSLRVAECLIKFGGDVAMIGTRNVDVMAREIYALDTAIAERKASVKADEVNVAEIFSKPELVAHPAKKALVSESVVAVESATEQESAIAEPAIRQSQSANDSAIRQSAILARIRQSGNCRLKDIQELFPLTSERTIRYDLQTLFEHGQIERVGIAGPSVFYRATRQAVPAESAPEAR